MANVFYIVTTEVGTAGPTAAGAGGAVGDTGTPVPIQGAVGVTVKLATYSSGYEHPATGVIPGAWSLVLNQPSTLAVTELGALVNVAVGSVIIGPVFVYDGRRENGTWAFEMVGGGQGNSVLEEIAIVVVEAPVCHGW
jgi:hypothetical protein